MGDRNMEHHNVLERILDGKMEPTNVKFSLLEEITDSFSEEQQIGEGGFGKVYKGVLKNGNVAVKRTMSNMTVDDKLFRTELKTLLKVNHKNVVRFFGFCIHTVENAIEVSGSGEHILAEVRERLLCFEYISNGSLTKYITDELRGLEWEKRYQIVKGICEGLNYLQKDKGFIHMDLKPDNILLDDHLVPKITDFGLARPDKISKTMSTNRFGSPGYCAPEYRDYGKMSHKSDMYSLGVIIIELVTGQRKIPDNNNNVLRRWRHRWNKTAKPTPLQYQQVTKCLEVAVKCMEREPRDRPADMMGIIRDLNEIENTNGSTSNANDSTTLQTNPCLELEEDMLGIEPLELRFPFELNKQISCTVELTNVTDNYIAFNIRKPMVLQYCTEPDKGIVQPRSNSTVKITLQAQKEAPEPQIERCGTNEFIVESTKVSQGLRAEDITEGMFSNKEAVAVVDEVNLTIVYEHEEQQLVDLSLEPLAVSGAKNLVNNTQGEASNVPEEEAVSKMMDYKQMLCFNPSELCFPSAPQEIAALYRTRSLQLINNSAQHHVSSSILAVGYTINPAKAIVPPGSTFTVLITPDDLQPPGTKDTISVRSVRLISKGGSHSNEEADGESVNTEDIKVVYSSQEMSSSPSIQPNVKVNWSIGQITGLTSVELNSAEPCTLFLHGGAIQIWNYDSKVLLCAPFHVERFFTRCSVSVVKFVERLETYLAGGQDGYIYAYSYKNFPTMEAVHYFQASSRGITSMDVHPTNTCFLSADDDGAIGLFNWQNWALTRVYNGHSGTVTEVKINPLDVNNTFASASRDGTVKVWKFDSSDPTFTLVGHSSDVTCLDYVISGDKLCLISGSTDKTVKVWEFQTGRCLRTLEDTFSVRAIYGHPNLPIIFAGLGDGTVRLWNSTTYRLDNSFVGAKSSVCSIAGKGTKWVAVGYANIVYMIKTDEEEA